MYKSINKSIKLFGDSVIKTFKKRRERVKLTGEILNVTKALLIKAISFKISCEKNYHKQITVLVWMVLQDHWDVTLNKDLVFNMMKHKSFK